MRLASDDEVTKMNVLDFTLRKAFYKQPKNVLFLSFFAQAGCALNVFQGRQEKSGLSEIRSPLAEDRVSGFGAGEACVGLKKIRSAIFATSF